MGGGKKSLKGGKERERRELTLKYSKRPALPFMDSLTVSWVDSGSMKYSMNPVYCRGTSIIGLIRSPISTCLHVLQLKRYLVLTRFPKLLIMKFIQAV